MTDRQRDLVQKFAALGSLVVLVAIFSFTTPAFFSMGNGMTIALQVTSLAYLGIGVTCVIVAGGIDLSLGSVLALAGVAAGLTVKAGMPVWLGMLVGLLVGSACGLLNGLFVAVLELPPFIATLGMTLVARGVALQLTGARPVSGLGESFGELGNGALFRVVREHGDDYPEVVFPGIPYPVIVTLVLAVVVAVMLNRTRVGRHIYAVGSNSEAARLSGVNVSRITVYAYTLAGFTAGLTGCVLMSRLVTAQPNEGMNYELDAIASAVIGGASLTAGGIGTISGTLIGAFVIGILRNGLNMNGVSNFVQQIIIGVVILATVWIDQLRNKRSSRVRVLSVSKQSKQTSETLQSSGKPNPEPKRGAQ